MHGRLKVKTSIEQQEEKRKQREEKTKAFTHGMKQVFKNRGITESSNTNLKLTEKLLSANPDVYTLWNVRKEIFVAMQKSNENIDDLLHKELSFLQTCLHVNPKSYGVWNQRQFVMNIMHNRDWAEELRLCNLFLKFDERNFHCWDYRRFVVKQSNILAEEEFKFTFQKISENFSNYSSWHNRSKLLPLINPDPAQLGNVSEEALLKEFELAQNAFFTDPNDQSAWFYQRWLLGRREHKACLLSLSLYRVPSLQVKVIASFSQPVNLTSTTSSILLFNGQQQHITWQPSELLLTGISVNHSCVWISNIPKLDSELDIKVSFPDIPSCPAELRLTLLSGHANTHLRWTTDKLSVDGYEKHVFSDNHTEAKLSVLEGELESCKMLLEEEPENKWTMLTIVHLMRALDELKYVNETEDLLAKLIKTDPMRTGYYRDLRSKYRIENELQKLYQEKNSLEDVDLSNKGLTSFSYGRYFTSCTKLNLCDNQLNKFSFCSMLTGVHNLMLDGKRIEEFDVEKFNAMFTCGISLIDDNKLE